MAGSSTAQRRKASACGLLRAEFRDLKLDPDRVDPAQHLCPQFARHRLGTAVLVHQALHYLFEAVLTQAGPALVKVLAYLGEPGIFDLAVQVAVDAREHLATGHIMRLTAAHLASFPGSSPDDDASPSLAAAALTRPRSAA